MTYQPMTCECPVGSKHGRTVLCGAAPVTRWQVPAYKRRPRREEWRCAQHVPKRGVLIIGKAAA